VTDAPRPTCLRSAIVVVALLACGDSGTEPAGDVRREVEGGPYGLDVRGDVALVTLAGRSAVVRLALPGLRPVATIIVGDVPTQVAFGPTGNTAYVTNQFSRSLGILDLASNTQVYALPLNGDPFVTAASADGKTVYVTVNIDSLFVIDAATRTVAARLPIPGAPNGLAFHPTAPALYVSASFGGTVTEVNTTAPNVAQTIFVGGIPQGLAVSPNGTALYVANLAGWIDVVNTDTRTLQDSIALPEDAGAFGLALAPDGATLYATLPHRGAVVRIATATGMVTQRYPTGGTPRRIAVHSSGVVVVANEDGWVEVLR
jgi:YVTN family beta-propeller protein